MALLATLLTICTANPCIIRESYGGRVSDFQQEAALLKERHVRVIIDGFCASSCMVLADKARPNVCITGNAEFAYHRTSFDRPIPLSRDITAWIEAHGGFPPFGQWRMLPWQIAKKFWPRCKKDPAF